MFNAWDYLFTEKQINEIINMSVHAKRHNMDLHDALRSKAPAVLILNHKLSSKNKTTTVRRPRALEKPCETGNCLGMMELFSVCCSDREMKKQGYLTKWECNKCGKVEYSKQTLDDARNFLMEGKNGTSK